MKNKLLSICFLVIFLFTSCSSSRINPNISKTGLENSQIQLVTVTNKRFAGKYTIIDKKIVERFKNTILKAKDAATTNKLDPDFTFDFYDQTKKVASFNYIAGISDDEIGNLIDDGGKIYHINSSIENEFIKRLMNKNNNYDNSMAPEYYISLIKDIIDKGKIANNSTVVVDIRKDYLVTKQLTSVEQKRILDSINERGIKIMFPTETDKWDYLILIRTDKFMNNKALAKVNLTDKGNNKVRYQFDGTYEKGKWSYHARIK